MQISQEGWLSEARVCPSPNFNSRPEFDEISLLVIHNISLPPGQFGTGCVEDFFQNKLDCSKHPFFQEISELKVSSHLLIERSGVIIQFVSFLDRAWHAGVSSFQGRENCNDFSVGIELEGTDCDAYSADQYQALIDVTRALQKQYPQIDLERIVGHCDIAPGRKTDPGKAFDWPLYRAELTKDDSL